MQSIHMHPSETSTKCRFISEEDMRQMLAEVASAIGRNSGFPAGAFALGYTETA